MRIVVTGATGLIGSSFVTDALMRGDEIVSLSRDITRARKLLPAGVNHYQWDALHEHPPLQAFQEADGVVNLLGEPISGRWTTTKKKLIYSSRVRATQNLTQGLAQLKYKSLVLVSASALGYYGDQKEDLLDENASSGTDFLSKVCVDWEAAALFGANERLDVQIVRFANVLAGNGGILPVLSKLYRFGLGSKLGTGNQWVPWIHITDAVAALRFALENPKLNFLNAVSPGIVRQSQFNNTLREFYKRQIMPGVPSIVLKVILGEFSAEILGSKRMIPQALQSSGFKFEFNQLNDAMKDLLSA